MACPVCGASHGAAETYCRRCGADVTIPSTMIVPVKPALPVVSERPSRVITPAKAGASLVALGVGYELLRWGLKLWLKKPVGRSLPALTALPTLGNLRNLHGGNRPPGRLPKGYEVTETVFYMQRVIQPKK
ncbi:MAG TPA: hypothetical protein VKT82_31105 [Ktedonobacterales bacterium]|nr:hypothetical protein [Ktedonobacterales bacterium]